MHTNEFDLLASTWPNQSSRFEIIFIGAIAILLPAYCSEYEKVTDNHQNSNTIHVECASVSIKIGEIDQHNKSYERGIAIISTHQCIDFCIGNTWNGHQESPEMLITRVPSVDCFLCSTALLRMFGIEFSVAMRRCFVWGERKWNANGNYSWGTLFANYPLADFRSDLMTAEKSSDIVIVAEYHALGIVLSLALSDSATLL